MTSSQLLSRGRSVFRYSTSTRLPTIRTPMAGSRPGGRWTDSDGHPISAGASPVDDQLPVVPGLEAQVLLPAGPARMHGLELVVPRRQRLVHRGPGPNATAIDVEGSSLCGGRERDERNVGRRVRYGLQRRRALEVTGPPRVRSLQRSVLYDHVAGTHSGALPVPGPGYGRWMDPR